MSIVDPSTFTLWAAMRSRVLRKAPEAPSFRLDDALREAAQEFFRTSRVWRSSRGTLLTTVADTVAYAYTPPTNAEVVQVMDAWNGTEEIKVILPGEEDDIKPDADTNCFMIGARPTDELYLSQIPTSAGLVITGTLSFMPSVDAVGIPEQAWNWWGEEIACGAAAILVTEPSKPWSQPNTYDFLKRVFDEGICEASNSAGPTRRRPLRVTPL